VYQNTRDLTGQFDLLDFVKKNRQNPE